MSKMKKFAFFLFLTILAFSANAAEPSVTASVDKTTVSEGNNLELKIVYENIEPAKLDIEPLREDFDILQAGNYSQIQMINNDYKKTVTDFYKLRPKKTGKIVIPAFTIQDNIATLPITINVLPTGSASAQQQTAGKTDDRFSLKGRTSNNNPYVQQEIIYTLSLIDSGGLQGHEPTFEAVNTKDWIIRSLGTPEINPLAVNGKNMREIVFRYAFFPQRSGRLTIPSARFEGYVLGRPQKHIDPFKDIFGDDLGATLGFTFAEREPVILRSQPVEIEVKPVPAANNGYWWLPANNLLLVDKWEPETPEFKVGEAVHRTIYLKANGVLDSQLPEIKFGETDGLKQYPEKPATEMSIERGSVVSIVKISNVYIPSQSGKITIPEIKVHWFDTVSEKAETAVIPSKEIDVAANPLVAEEQETPRISNAEQALAPSPPQPAADKQTSASTTQITEKLSRFGNTEIILLLLGAFGLGIALSYLLFRKKHPACAKEQINDYLKYIVKKAKEKDLRAIRDALPEWCAEKYGVMKVNGFNDINKLVKDKEFAAELDKLTAELYSDNKGNWDAKAFIAAFENVEKKHVRTKQNEKLLPDLYK